jgi:hypothetical protein
MTRAATSRPHTGAGRQARETQDIEHYLAALFGREDRRAYIEVRYRHDDTMRRHFLAHTDTFAAARTIARLSLSSDVYIGVAPRRHDDTGGKDAIDRVWTLWADIDTPNAHDALRAVPVTPAILIASGTPGHLHAYRPLSEAVGITAAETANRRLAAQLGADAGAVTNAATILRPPGTYSFKTTPPTPVLARRLEPALTTLEAATDAIAEDRPRPAPTTPVPRSTPPPGSDPLRGLDPAHYVGVLTGQAVGRSRKITCPFHDDRTPSLHVYEHPEDGWYCFGCKRHGHTVYDLASLLWDLDTRGPSFIELRARLYDLFLPGQSPPLRYAARDRRRA